MERKKVNNTFYDELKEEWHECDNHPIALLRAENRARIPWVQKHLFPCSTILDIGCGGGLLANALAKVGHTVSGIDLSKESLRIAVQADVTQSVNYSYADAYTLPFPEKSFDVVCALDLLEHVDRPGLVVKEAARVLRPGGQFFFHTFNRNWISYLLVLKGVEWFVPNVPKQMHLYHYFIKPEELKHMLTENGLKIKEMHGLNPTWNRAFWKMLFTRRISEEFQFKFTRSLQCGYVGCATSLIN